MIRVSFEVAVRKLDQIIIDIEQTQYRMPEHNIGVVVAVWAANKIGVRKSKNGICFCELKKKVRRAVGR